MKQLGKKFIERTASNPTMWSLYRMCGQIPGYFHRIFVRAQAVRQHSELQARVLLLFPDLKVATGPFKGLQYPSARSSGSALLPKLFGSYELELHPAFEELLKNSYATVVDIGCAEGYYAVGLAQRLPSAQVYAFDTDPTAKELLAQMAKLNGVEERIHIGDFCNEEALRSLPLGARSLIISDCEGYEASLFNAGLAEYLSRHDLIIETHDSIDIEISVKMREAFRETHHIRSIKSVDDIERAHTFQYRALEGYSRADKRRILGEYRPSIMEWLVMTSKRHD